MERKNHETKAKKLNNRKKFLLCLQVIIAVVAVGALVMGVKVSDIKKLVLFADTVSGNEFQTVSGSDLDNEDDQDTGDGGENSENGDTVSDSDVSSGDIVSPGEPETPETPETPESTVPVAVLHYIRYVEVYPEPTIDSEETDNGSDNGNETGESEDTGNTGNENTPSSGEETVSDGDSGSNDANDGDQGQGNSENNDPGNGSGNDPQNGSESAPAGPTYRKVPSTMEFTSVAAAIAAAEDYYVISNEHRGQSETEFLPYITLCGDSEVNTTINVTANTHNLTLDLNGHDIVFKDTAYFNISASMEFTITDSSQTPGVVKGSYEYIFDGTGTLNIDGGNFISEQTSIIGSMLLYANGGFYVYSDDFGFGKISSPILRERDVFISDTRTIHGVEYTGFYIDRATFVNSYTVNEQAFSDYYGNFRDAWSGAMEKSASNSNVIVKIDTLNTESKTVSVTELSILLKGKILLDGLDFERSEGFRDGFFKISAGELILNDVTLNGSITTGDVRYSTAPLISYEGGKLCISGSSEKGTLIENNLANTTSAGIFVKGGLSMDMAGYVDVCDNFVMVTPDDIYVNGTKPSNIFLGDDASVTLISRVRCNKKIGISYGDPIIAGYTYVGAIGADYQQSFAEDEIDDPETEGDERLAFFTSDAVGYKSYYMVYNETSNLFYWDRSVKLLPEAGIDRIEYILIPIGMLLLIIVLFAIRKNARLARGIVSGIAVLFILAGAGFAVYHIELEKEISRENQEIIKEISASIKKNSLANVPALDSDIIPEVVTEDREVVEENKNISVPKDGREYIGVIEIPDYDITLPVLAEYSGASMKTTPCVYYGDIDTSDLVIVGHNYDTQFGALRECEDETEVILTLTDGSVYEYTSYLTEEMNPDEVDRMIEGNWDLTLFTCSLNGEKRVAIRCDLLETGVE
ncbi:MAG: sortase [Lachnospiraceae bacterium]|nr:sortase [Lachnospiraceae bacterium]